MSSAKHAENSFVNENGIEIYYQMWRPQTEHKANVLIAHGIGEHSDRYAHVASFLVERGVAVFALDHQGHGKSGGKRGHVANFEDFVRDVETLRRTTEPEQHGRPLFLLGHSMGGLIGFLYVLDHPDALQGAVFSSPGLALSLKIPAWKIILGKIFALIAPSVTMPNGIDPALLSHDQEIVRAYVEDERVHDRASAALFFGMLAAMDRCSSEASRVSLPTLLLLGSEDQLIDVRGVQEIFKSIPHKDKKTVVFEGFYHEIFNEVERQKVLDEFWNWLEPRII